jgi:hypothetical protein
MSMLQVNLFHVIVQGPLLAYIGNKKDNTPEMAYTIVLVMAFLIPFIVRFPNFKYKNSYYKILYLHYFFIMPAFIYIGLKGNNLNPKFYQPLFYTGILISLYHGYKASQRL